MGRLFVAIWKNPVLAGGGLKGVWGNGWKDKDEDLPGTQTRRTVCDTVKVVTLQRK